MGLITMYILKHRKDKGPVHIILETADLKAAIEFVNELPRATIGEKMWLAIGDKNKAFIDGPHWFESQDFIDTGDETIELRPMVVINPSSINFIYDIESPMLDLVKVMNDWSYVNRDDQHVVFKDGDAPLKIDVGYAVIEIACGSKTYAGYPFTMTYDGGKTFIYYSTLEWLRRGLVSHDVALTYN